VLVFRARWADVGAPALRAPTTPRGRAAAAPLGVISTRYPCGEANIAGFCPLRFQRHRNTNALPWRNSNAPCRYGGTPPRQRFAPPQPKVARRRPPSWVIERTELRRAKRVGHSPRRATRAGQAGPRGALLRALPRKMVAGFSQAGGESGTPPRLLVLHFVFQRTQAMKNKMQNQKAAVGRVCRCRVCRSVRRCELLRGAAGFRLGRAVRLCESCMASEGLMQFIFLGGRL
jgi:hypothetical protein